VIHPDNSPLPESEPLEEILARVRFRLKRVLKNYSIPVQEAEDLLQETLLDALQQWSSIRHLESWLCGTLRFKCAKYWKRQRIERRLQVVDPSLLEDLCKPQPPAQEQGDLVADLRRLTRGLAKRHRAVLWLRFGLGLSTDEVAQQLGYCPASIRKLTGRTLSRLRRWAAAKPDDGASS